MSAAPKISVVIPVYNGERFIARTIQSVLAQDTPAHEILVMDDGSTDGTPEIVARFGSRVRLERMKNSGGPSAPRNTGIRLATGDWIALLDADDFWFRRKLTVESDYIRRFPEIDLLGCNFITRTHRSRLVRHFSQISPRAYEFGRPLVHSAYGRLMAENFFGTPSAVTLRRSLALEAGLFDPSRKVVEDLEFFLRASMRARVLLIPEVLAYKRSHDTNVSNDKVRLFVVQRDVLLESRAKNAGYIREHGLQRDVRHALSQLDFQLGNALFEAGERSRAFGVYWRAVADNPSPATVMKFFWSAGKKAVRAATGFRRS